MGRPTYYRFGDGGSGTAGGPEGRWPAAQRRGQGEEEASLSGAGVARPGRGGRGRSGWRLAAAVLLAVLGPAPPALAQGATPQGCAAALAAAGTRWDGVPMEQFTWDGQTTELPDLLGAPLALCPASGP